MTYCYIHCCTNKINTKGTRIPQQYHVVKYEYRYKREREKLSDKREEVYISLRNEFI
jgi:hypothetical protein